jgi:hypothetical protein
VRWLILFLLTCPSCHPRIFLALNFLSWFCAGLDFPPVRSSAKSLRLSSHRIFRSLPEGFSLPDFGAACAIRFSCLSFSLRCKALIFPPPRVFCSVSRCFPLNAQGWPRSALVLAFFVGLLSVFSSLLGVQVIAAP